jgi:FAD-dependent monooxygenase
MKFETLVETDDGVESQLIDSAGETHVIKSKYVIGCDGAGSHVRRTIGGNLIGGPV